ncbi:MAG: NADH-quinone oxidoreductase subunit L [Desulfurococcaceae archaeon]|nr:MAG: NADH-quinone oxidoreductase subunit L [Desulfurococcaceae archaeon]
MILMPVEVWWAPLVWGIPFLGSLAAGLTGIFNKRLAAILGSISLGISALLTIPLIMVYVESGDVIVSPRYTWLTIPLGNGVVDVGLGVFLDGISLVLTAMVAWISFLIGVYSLSYMRGDYGEHRYWIFFSFFVGSMLLLVMTDNLLLLIIGWEGTSLASYALIGHWYRDEEHAWVGDPGRSALKKPMWFTPSHAGVRAIIMTGVPDIGFMLGATAIILMSGTAYIPDLYKGLAPLMGDLASKGLLTGFLLLFTLGALAKSAQFPLHEWLVTAMTGPASVSALIHAATMVKAGVYFMLRFVPIFIVSSSIVGDAAIAQTRDYLAIIGGIGVFTAFMMATMAVVARELKLILAFSTASQIGYMFMAASYAGMLKEPGLGIVAGLSHLLSHAVFKASLFLGAGILIHELGSRYIDGIGIKARSLRITMLSMILASLGLAALPPFSGYWSKDLVVDTSLEAGFLQASALAIITSFLTAAYTFRMISILYLYREKESLEALPGHGKTHGEDPVAFMPYLLLAIATPVIGVAWALWINYFSEISLRGTYLHMPEIHYNPQVAVVSALVSILGAALALSIYGPFGHNILPKIRGERFLAAINRFLYDRWYFNPLLYIVFVDGGSKMIRAIGKGFEGAVIDNIYHKALPGIMESLSRILRNYQPSIINSYLLLMLLGIAILVILQMMG